MAKKNYESQRDDYMTPSAIYEPLLQLIRYFEPGRTKFDFDVCCSTNNIPAVFYMLDGKEDALMSSWHGWCFMNPPFKTAEKWVRKAVAEAERGNGRTVIMSVLPADRLETKYMQECVLKNDHCTFAFLQGKQGFYVPGDIFGECIPSQKIMIVIFCGNFYNMKEIAVAWQKLKLFNTQIFMGGHF